MFRRLATVAVAAVFLVVSPAPAALAQVTQIPASSAQQAARNIEVATQVSSRAARLVTSIDQTEVTQATTVEAYVAAIDRLAPEISRARGELTAMRAQLRALPRVGGNDGPVQLRSVDHIIDDTGDFLQRVDTMLGGYAEVADGFRSNDRQRAERALKTLSGATMTLIDGQALMMRGRATLVGSDRSDYAHAEGIACLYDGFAAVMRARLDLIRPDEAETRIEAARVCMDQQIGNGRAALARERAATSSVPAVRELEVRLAEISARVFVKMEEGRDVLGEAILVVRSGGSGDRLVPPIERFVAFERELSALGAEQARNLTSRSPG